MLPLYSCHVSRGRRRTLLRPRRPLGDQRGGHLWQLPRSPPRQHSSDESAGSPSRIALGVARRQGGGLITIRDHDVTLDHQSVHHPVTAVGHEIVREGFDNRSQRTRPVQLARSAEISPLPNQRPRVHQCAFRGRGWHRGQVKDERFMNGSRRIAVPQRGHGSSSRPYTASDRSK